MNFLPHSSSRILRPLLTFVFAAFIVSFSAKNFSAQRPDPKCMTPSAVMERETNEYIRKNNIRLKSSRSKYYGNADNEVFVLLSEERVDLQRKKPFENVSGVVYARNSKGRKNFYTIEEKITEKGFSFSIKEGRRVLQTINMDSKLGVPGPGGTVPPPPPKICKDYRAQFDSTVAGMAAAANQTCKRQITCLPLCIPENNPYSIAYVTVFADPTSWRCRIFSSQHMDLSLSYLDIKINDMTSDDGFVFDAIDESIKNQIALYDPIAIERRR